MSSVSLRIGLIGCGGIAPAHLACYQQNAHASVVAVADIAPAAERLAARTGAVAYTDHRRMLEQERLDAVPLDDPALPGNHRFQREIDHFIACVLEETEPEIDAPEGIADLVVLEAAYQAMRSGAATPV